MFKLTTLKSLPRTLIQQYSQAFIQFRPNNITRSYEDIPDNADVALNKEEFKPPLTKPRQRRMLHRELDRMKSKLREEAEQATNPELNRISNEDIKESLYQDNEEPPIRKYGRIQAKELYWKPRVDNIYEYNNRKMNYLKEFQEPYTLHEEHSRAIIEELTTVLNQKFNTRLLNIQDPFFNATQSIFIENPDVIAKLKDLASIIPKIHYKHYPNIALALAYQLRYKEDIAGIWANMETELFKVLHNVTTLEIVKLRYALGGFMPKGGSAKLHKAFIDILSNDLPGCGINELLHIYHAFRMSKNEVFHAKLFNEIITKGPAFVKDDPDLLANTIYTYMNCRLLARHKNKFREPDLDDKEANRFLDKFVDLLEQNVKQMSIDSLCKLALSLSVLRVDLYGDIVLKIERTIVSRNNELDAFQTANIIYAFSKTNGFALAGRPSFYEAMEKNVIKFKDQFNSHEMSRIIYAFAARSLATNQLKNIVFLPWIKANLADANFVELANIAYSLMFMEVKDAEIWKAFAKTVNAQSLVCPLIYYKPLKLAEHYIHNLFPKWDLSLYQDTIFEASREFSTWRQQKSYEKLEYYDLSRIIIVDIGIDAHIWVEWENLLIVDYAILPNKVGILLQKKSDSLPFSKEASPRHLLKQKILEINGWRILNIEHESFLEMGPGRKEWLEKEINKLTEETKYRVQEKEDQRRAYATMQYIEQQRGVSISNAEDQKLFNKKIQGDLDQASQVKIPKITETIKQKGKEKGKFDKEKGKFEKK